MQLNWFQILIRVLSFLMFQELCPALLMGEPFLFWAELRLSRASAKLQGRLMQYHIFLKRCVNNSVAETLAFPPLASDPTLDNLRNLLLTSTTEVLSFFQNLRAQ